MHLQTIQIAFQQCFLEPSVMMCHECRIFAEVRESESSVQEKADEYGADLLQRITKNPMAGMNCEVRDVAHLAVRWHHS